MSKDINHKKKFPFFKAHPRGLILNVFIQPRSSRNMVAGLYGEALKIKLTAPPVEGAANRMCIDYLSKVFKISRSSIEIISGHASRSKRLLIKCDLDHTSTEINERLRMYL